jgi:hypothetical protein
MIDEQKIIGMIPAKALECLSADDETELSSYVDGGFEFPWAELGKYQVIASLLPLSLQLEIPEPRLKDNVALRLIKLAEELRLKRLQEEEALNALQEPEQIVEDIPVQIDQNIDIESQDISFKDHGETESFNLDEISLPDIENYQLPAEETIISENQPEEKTDLIENQTLDKSDTTIDIPSFEEISAPHVQVIEPIEEASNNFIAESEKDTLETPEPEAFTLSDRKTVEEVVETKITETGKKSLNEKIFKALQQDFDTLKNSVDESEKKTTKNLLLAYVAIAILLALLIFAFFKFTADINSLEKKVEDLQKRVTSELIDDKKSNSDLSSLC